jgi:hypothetical protein
MFVLYPVCAADGNFPRPSQSWGSYDTKTMRLCAVLTGIFAGYLAIYLRAILQPELPHQSGDFIAIWSYARILFTHPVADLYDVVVLHAAQVDLGMDPSGDAPFPYAPTFLLMLWPLGLPQLWYSISVRSTPGGAQPW